MRHFTLSAVLLASASLASCASTWTPPEITYDDTPKPALLAADAPRPVRIVEMPKLLPLPGQLKPLPGRLVAGAPEPVDPRKRVEAANGSARIQPTRAGNLR